MSNKKEEAKIKKLAAEKKIVFAPQVKVQELRPWLEEIRKAFGISRWFISDQSSVGDFNLSDEELQDIRNDLGIDVEHKDYLIEVAQKLKEKVTRRK